MIVALRSGTSIKMEQKRCRAGPEVEGPKRMTFAQLLLANEQLNCHFQLL